MDVTEGEIREKIDAVLGVEHNRFYRHNDNYDVVYYVPTGVIESVNMKLEGIEMVSAYHWGQVCDQEA
jgi:hypothetical protein